MNSTEPESRPVLGPTGNKTRSVELRKPILKPKSEKTKTPLDHLLTEESKEKKSPEKLSSYSPQSPLGYNRKNAMSAAACYLRQRQHNLSMNASCSSDASTDSSHSRASTGRIIRRGCIGGGVIRRKQQFSSNVERIDKIVVGVEGEGVGAVDKKRCGWVTTNTDPAYAAFHDEEWGLPVHDDKKLFELLSFSTALAELTWPAILSKRHIFRDVFLDFDPVAVSKLNEKKLIATGSPACSLLSEAKLRGIIENARQICKIIHEFGSFDTYIWGFVNHKPVVGSFRYPRQVPIKTSKADFISKDLVRRGFRGVGPTVVYSFMQVAGITNDHLISCFKYHDCVIAGELREKNEGKNEVKQPEDITELELVRDIDDLSLSR